jgi:hypothetical protein
MHGLGQTRTFEEKKGVKESSFPEVSSDQHDVFAVNFAVAVYVTVQIPFWRRW